MLFQDFQGESLLQLHPCGPKNRANGASSSALLTDHLTEVRRMDTKLENRDLFTLDGPDLNLIRIVHERFRNSFDQLLHWGLPFNRVQRRGGRPDVLFWPEVLVSPGRSDDSFKPGSELRSLGL